MKSYFTMMAPHFDSAKMQLHVDDEEFLWLRREEERFPPTEYIDIT